MCCRSVPSMTYSLIYLIDCSGSMNNDKGISDSVGSKLKLVKKNLLDFFGNAKAFRPGDRVGILCYSQKKMNSFDINTVMPLEDVYSITAGNKMPTAALWAIAGGGGAPLGPAMREAIRLLGEAGAGSKGMTIITDGSASNGEDPLVVVSDAIIKGIRVDVVGLGVPAEDSVLKPLALRTNGHFKRVSTVHEITNALIWERTQIPMSDKSALLIADRSIVSDELKLLNEMNSKGAVDSQVYASKKQALEAKLEGMKAAIVEVSANALKAQEALRQQIEAPSRQLAELKAYLEKKGFDKKAYLAQAAPIEAKLASWNKEIDAQQQLIDILK